MSQSYITSYAGLFGHKEAEAPAVKSIRIPLIQRDFAQGRRNNEVNRIRNAFLDVVHEALTGGEPINLDFVYGNVIEDGVFEPLDGQQRLTTLFLLHVYLAHCAGALEKTAPWRKFTYLTRASARLFCERLVDCSPESGTPHQSKWIIDQWWYLYPWKHDPTIKSMLVVIDAIHERFKDENAEAAWRRLVDPQTPAITFHLLSLAELKLTDQLYIKMNSRGKPLTSFETFKVRFEKMLETSCPERAQEFASKVDGDWSDLLWSYRSKDDDVIDNKFLRYFHFVTELLAWWKNHHKSSDFDELTKAVYDPKKSEGDGPEKSAAENHLDFLISAFDTWTGVGIPAWFEEHFALKTPPLTTGETARTVITGLQDHPNTDLFDAACHRYGLPRGRGGFPLSFTLYLHGVLLHRLRDTDDFSRRMRILRNLLEASGFNLRVENMPQLVQETERIVVDGNLDEVSTFNVHQIEQERRKHKLLAQHPELEMPLFQLEDHQLLRGNLTAFDLEPERFAVRAAAFHRLFAEPVDYKALTGALLAIGDYSRQHNRRIFRLGSSSNSAAGIWRDLLTGVSPDRMKKLRSALRELLDRVSASEHPISKQLADISSQWLDDREHQRIYDWRTYFVKYPAMREGKSGRYVGWKGNLGYLVCMLETIRVVRHRDPYLLTIHRLSGVVDALPRPWPWFNGHESNSRWLSLSSGAGLQMVEGGIALRPPSDEEKRKSFAHVCTTHGVVENVLPVPQVERDGVLVDTEDRVCLGAKLLRDLVAAGL